MLSHFFYDRLLQLVPDLLRQLLQVFGSHVGRRAGGPWSWSKVLLDRDTSSSNTHMTKVF